MNLSTSNKQIKCGVWCSRSTLKKAYDSISWDFVDEVMRKKGFEDVLRNWITSIVRGVECVSTSMEKIPYFKTHRGLRQGDPLSPLLFNQAVDVLARIMTKAKE